MRNAGADELKKYLKMRIEEGEVQKEEQKQAVIKNIPGAKGDYDIWDTLLREFITNNALDLRNKVRTYYEYYYYYYYFIGNTRDIE